MVDDDDDDDDDMPPPVLPEATSETGVLVSLWLAPADIAGRIKCGDCGHFTADAIGDSMGVGRCALRLVRAPFPLALRRCQEYDPSCND